MSSVFVEYHDPRINMCTSYLGRQEATYKQYARLVQGGEGVDSCILDLCIDWTNYLEVLRALVISPLRPLKCKIEEIDSSNDGIYLVFTHKAWGY